MTRELLRATTILGVRHKGEVVIGGDGQVSLGQTVMKQQSNKIRLLSNGKVLAGFAGSVADSFSLLERFEEQLSQHSGHLVRAAAELAKLWRTDKYLRQLEALLAVLDKDHALIISGTGEVIEPDDGIVAVGSGGMYALAAARMLLKHTSLPARAIVEESLHAAADICVYTNHHITTRVLEEGNA